MPIDSRGARFGRWGGIAVVFAIAMAIVRPVPMLDLAALDLGFRIVNWIRPSTPADELVIVGIDEATLAEWPEPLALMHRHLGTLLAALAVGGARAAAVDVVLPDRSFDAVAPGYDAALLDGILAMRAVGPVVLAKSIDDAGQERVIHPPFLSAAGPDGSGFAVLPVDADGKVRRVVDALSTGDGVVPTFVGQLAHDLGLPMRPGSIDFTRPIGGTPISMRTVLEWARTDDRKALRAALEGKVVFVGALLPFTDRHRIPVPLTDAFPASATPGVLAHAQALHDLARGHRIVEWHAASIAFAAIACLVVWWGSTTWIRAMLFTGLGVALATGLGVGGLLSGADIPLGNATLALILCSSTRLSLEVGSEILARRRLRRTFAGYVSPAVMTELEEGRLEGLFSRRTHLCAMFLDVRGFTKRTESEPPEAVLAMLRLLFETVTRIVHEHGGTVNQFMGDGVLALFGAPVAMENPEQAAFDTARTTLAELVDVNRSLASANHAPIAIGMGLASGEAVVGNIGASTRYAYGAIGDCLNLASRLEGLTKTLGQPILMSASVAARIDRRAELVDRGLQPITGHEAARVFGWAMQDPP